MYKIPVIIFEISLTSQAVKICIGIAPSFLLTISKIWLRRLTWD
jgi:hypothetical protein